MRWFLVATYPIVLAASCLFLGERAYELYRHHAEAQEMRKIGRNSLMLSEETYRAIDAGHNREAAREIAERRLAEIGWNWEKWIAAKAARDADEAVERP